MSTYIDKTKKKLNLLLEKTYDAEKGYHKAADHVDSAILKDFFSQKAKERQKFRVELRKELLDNGCDIKEKDGSIIGGVHRGWMSTKALFSTNEEESILNEAKTGEKAAIKDYEEVLEDNKLPPTTEQLLISQKNEIEKSYNKAHHFEEVS